MVTAEAKVKMVASISAKKICKDGTVIDYGEVWSSEPKVVTKSIMDKIKSALGVEE